MLEINGNLRDRFNKKGFSPTAYSRAKNIHIDTLLKILRGALTGEKETKKGVTRRVIALLKKDGVWIGKLPWEN
jgi:hypothetical protein